MLLIDSDVYFILFFAAKIFPALDLLRFAIRHGAVCDYFCGVERRGFFLEFLLPLVKGHKFPANQQLTLKLISNIFLGGKNGTDFLAQQRKPILAAIVEAAPNSPDKNVQIGRATVLLNFSVLANKSGSTDERMELLYTLAEIAKVKLHLFIDSSTCQLFYRFFVRWIIDCYELLDHSLAQLSDWLIDWQFGVTWRHRR